MLTAGELPAIAKLVERGVRAPLVSRKPLVSPPVWTTIATGVTRDRHEIRGFKVGDQLVSSRDRRAPALWTIASAAGLRTAVLAWWATYPAETIDGVVVSERAFKTREWSIQSVFAPRLTHTRWLVHPESVAPLLADLLGEHPEPNLGELETTRQRMRIEDRAVVDALSLVRRSDGPFDLEMILLRGVDVVSHHFWKFHEPDAAAYAPADRPTPEQVDQSGDVVRAQYRLVDSLVAELVAEDADRTFVLVSDHGFEAGRQRFRRGVLSGTHHSDAALRGIFVAAGPAMAEGVSAEEISILDVAPLVLRILRVPAPEALTGAVPEAWLDARWAADHPVREGVPYAGPASNLSEESRTAEDPTSDEMLRQELEALGYIR